MRCSARRRIRGPSSNAARSHEQLRPRRVDRRVTLTERHCNESMTEMGDAWFDFSVLVRNSLMPACMHWLVGSVDWLIGAHDRGWSCSCVHAFHGDWNFVIRLPLSLSPPSPHRGFCLVLFVLCVCSDFVLSLVQGLDHIVS